MLCSLPCINPNTVGRCPQLCKPAFYWAAGEFIARKLISARGPFVSPSERPRPRSWSRPRECGTLPEAQFGNSSSSSVEFDCYF
jgi:hypothetical protein